MLLVISYALGPGRRQAAFIVAGVALGDLTAMTASMLGLGAVLAASAAVFTALHWVGGAYLVYLGIKLWRAPVGAVEDRASSAAGPGRVFAHTYAVTALNPKSLVFFVAFVPQFLDPADDFLAQAAVAIGTFVGMAALSLLGVALLASAVRQRLRQPRVQRVVNRTGGSLLIGAGALAIGWRRTA